MYRSEADVSDEKHLRLLSEVSFDTDNASSSSCEGTLQSVLEIWR